MALSLILALVVLVGQVQCQFDYDSEPTRDQIVEGCFGKVADIFIILDSSTSIYVIDYRQQLQFARDVVSRFDIGQRTTRVGILTFSDDITRPPLELNRFPTKSDLLVSITEQNLPYRTGITNTDQAIRYVRENPAFRYGITKAIIVVTDGGSRSPWNTAREADLAREQGFYLFVVGYGQYQDEREWRNIANDPDDNFIFNGSNARVFEQVKLTLPSRICALPPLDVSRRCDVERNADVFFVAGPGGTQDAVQVIDRFVEATTDNSNFLRVSYLLGICANAENIPLTNLNNYCDRLQVQAPATLETYIQLLSRLRTIARQSRRGAKQLAVLFVDEETLRLNRFGLISEARNVGQIDNIEIIVVDLGTRGYGNIIQGIAPSRDNVITFSAGNVASQRTVLNTLIDRTCTVINGESFIDGFTPS